MPKYFWNKDIYVSKIYLSNFIAPTDEVKRLSDEHGYVLKVVQTSSQGFHAQLMLPKSNEDFQIPKDFTQVNLW